MNIVSVGGGPGGLYFALLMKKLDPRHNITVVERNRANDTFGWGVVFSRETLGTLLEADDATHDEITKHFAYWDDIETFFGGTMVRSTGHGFCGLSRKKLLNILQDRCRDLGVDLVFEREVSDLSVAPFADADLILAADGVNSGIRTQYEQEFQPTIEWGKTKFCWLGTTLPLGAFTFIFEENEHGLFQVHAYPFESGTSTFIVECTEQTWKNAGLDQATEDETVAYCEKLFVDYLKGHKLLTNRSLWRTFPTITCEQWYHENIVLLGDSAHTAHFSIGSGTKLAMESALVLAEQFSELGTADVPTVLAAYQDVRRTDTIRLQRAAYTSERWFENAPRYARQHPVQFSFNLLTRSKRITYDNLRLRDPEFVFTVKEWFAQHVAKLPARTHGQAPVPIFTPFTLRGMELVNRIVVSPMCMYSAVDGTPNDWHFVHLGSRAVGGAGLIFTEMTNVSADARITPRCAGMYAPEHVDAWKRTVEFTHAHSPAKIGMQLGHAGRKGSTKLMWEGSDEPLEDGNWPIISASPLPYFPHSQIPKEMDRADMDTVRENFAASANMANDAGFDMLELHMAHGYLLSSFISPLTNVRTDEYGGDIDARMKFPLEVFDAVRAVWPDDKPVSVRISATDWAPGGLDPDDLLRLAQLFLDHGCDILDVSTGLVVADQDPRYGRMWQVPFSEMIRHNVDIPTMSVGGIQGPDHCNTILASGRADLCVMARPHLANPYITLHAAEEYEYEEQHWPVQYQAARPRPKK